MLKKMFSILIMILLLVGFCGNVLAEDTYTATSTINGVTANWEYEINDLNQIENLKCTNPADLTGNIAVPSTLDGKTVVSLKSESFKSAINITGVTIPNSIKIIGYGSFSNCSNLVNVNLGQLEKISFDAFKDCDNLKSITIPKTLVNGDGVYTGIFTGKTNLTSVTFEEGITEIPSSILKDCTGITKVTIPSSVKIINEYAFANTSISEIEVPNSVTTIKFYAFRDCSKLVKATILDNCASIGWFNSQPDKDTVFTNHNENLTIYCYKDSKIAEYAIANNIKYAYLTKPSSEQPSDDSNKNEQTNTNNSNLNNNNSNNSNSSNGTNNNGSSQKDDTTAKTPIPKAGEKASISIVISIVLASGVFSYFKFYKYRDIK